MSTDITYCANSEECSVSDRCKRAFTGEVAGSLIGQPLTFSFAKFEPEKGRDCIGYKAPLTLNPLEDK